MALIQNSVNRLPLIITKNGVAVTGLLSTDFLNASIQVIKSDGTKSLVPLVDSGIGKNLFEIDSINSPGLYHVLVLAPITSLTGSFQYSIVPAATLFDSKVFLNEVSSDLVRKLLTNNESLDQSNGVLTIYDDNGIDPLYQWYLQDSNSTPSIFNIRRKIVKFPV